MIDPARLPRQGALAPFTDGELAELAALMEECSLEMGQPVYREGGDDACLAIVLEGRLELHKMTPFGERHVVMGIFHPGSVVGEACLFAGKSCTLTAAAMEHCHVGVISHDSLNRLLEESPRTGNKLMKVLLIAVSRRLNQAYERIAEVF